MTDTSHHLGGRRLGWFAVFCALALPWAASCSTPGVQAAARRVDPQVVVATGDDLARCRALTGYRGPAERCHAEAIGGGALALVRIVTECAGDACDVRGWLFGRGLAGASPLPAAVDAGGAIDAAPDGAFLVADAQHVPDGEMVPELRTIRVPLRAEGPAAPSVFAPCFSPRLSPAGRFFVCRDRAAGVWRVPVDGGQPQLVARAGVDAADVEWVPHAYVYPDRVSFPAPDRLSFAVELREGDRLERSVRWDE